MRRAIIVSIEDDGISLGLLPEKCSESSACHECGLCSSAGAGSELMRLLVDGFGGVSKGDIVEVEVSAPRGSLIALAIYMMPLLLMFVGGYLGNLSAGDIGMIIGGAGGLIISIFLIYILNHSVFKINGKILRKV